MTIEKAAMLPMVDACALIAQNSERQKGLRGKIRVTVAGGVITMTAFDLTTYVMKFAPVDGMDEFDVCISSKRLKSVVAQCGDKIALSVLEKKDERSEAEVEDGTGACGALIVESGAKFTIAYTPGKEYPEFPKENDAPGVVIDAEALKFLIERTKYAKATEPGRYAISGLKLVAKDGRIDAIATNGKILCLAKRPCEGELDALIPPCAIGSILAMCDEGGGIKLLRVDNRLYAGNGSTSLISSVLDGSFPDYERVIPKDVNTHITVNSKAMLAGIESVGIIKGDDCAGVFEMNLNMYDGVGVREKLGLSAREAYCTAESTVQCLIEGTPPVSVLHFKHEYFALIFGAICQSYDGDIKLSVKGASSPMLVKEGTDFTAVIMPCVKE